MLIGGLKCGFCKISRILKFQGPKCSYFGLKFRVGEIIWGMIFLCPQKLIFSLKILGGQLIISGFEQLVCLSGGQRKLLDKSTIPW